MKKTTQVAREHCIAIYETAREAIVSGVQFVRDAWPLLLLLLSGLAVAIWLAKPAPPDHVYLATSTPGGEFSAMGKEYVAYFRTQGVTLELVASQGGQQNFEMLKSKQNKVQAAFVQSGIISSGESAGLLSLGSLNYEPLWFFYRGADIPEAEQRIGVLLKNRISLGHEGSGTHVQAQRILELNGYLPTAPNMLSLGQDEAIDALGRGDIDGMFILNSIDSPPVQRLLHDPAIRLISFTRAHAYARQMNYISVLEVPMGGFDLSRNFPQRDTQLLAATVSLIVDADLHPAIQMLFLQAASIINGRGDYFARINEFPAYRDASVPESEVATRYRKSGLPFLTRYLPFWIAEFIDRLAVLIVPLAVVSYPIIGKIPNYRLERKRTRLNKIHEELKLLKTEIVTHYKPEAYQEYLQQLDKLESRVVDIKTPSSLSESCFLLTMHIDFVRSQLAQSQKSAAQ
jgi:TRAP-type uncharacterized transport system substrate-binding protein